MISQNAKQLNDTDFLDANLFLNTPQQTQIQSPTTNLLNDLHNGETKPIITAPESPIDLLNTTHSNSNIRLVSADPQSQTPNSKLVLFELLRIKHLFLCYLRLSNKKLPMKVKKMY
jgi:hypothetical protein